MNTRQAQNYNLWISIGVVIFALLLILFWWTGGMDRWLEGTTSTLVDQPATPEPLTSDTAVPAPGSAEQQPADTSPTVSGAEEAPAVEN